MISIASRARAQPTGCPPAVNPWKNSSALYEASIISWVIFSPSMTAPKGKKPEVMHLDAIKISG